MSVTLAIVAAILLYAAYYARHHSVEGSGFGQRIIPLAKGFIEDVERGAQGVGIAPCEVCGYEGQDRRFRHVSGLYLCDDCHAFDGGKLGI